METLHDRIEALCQNNNETIADMCSALDLRRSTISELKAGRSKTLSLPCLIKIADHFGIPIDYLIGRQVPTQNINQSIIGDGNSHNVIGAWQTTSPLEEAVLCAMKKMTDAEKACVVKYAYEIIDQK